MKKKPFKKLLEEVCWEVFGYEITKYEKKYCWNKIKNIPKEIGNSIHRAMDVAEIIDYSPQELVRFRQALAMKGTEMTPRQVNIYIMGLDIMLIDTGFYEWEPEEV